MDNPTGLTNWALHQTWRQDQIGIVSRLIAHQLTIGEWPADIESYKGMKAALLTISIDGWLAVYFLNCYDDYLACDEMASGG